MSAISSIKFDSTTGNLFEKFSNIGNTIALSNSDNTDVISWEWELISVPENSVAVLSSGTSPTPTFVVDKVGSYLVSLKVNGGGATGTPFDNEMDQKVYAILTQGFENRLPAEGESTETTHGWSDDANTAFMGIEMGSGRGAVEVCENAEGSDLTAGQAVKKSGVNDFIKTVELATEDDLNIEKIGIVIGSPDSSETISNGEKVLICWAGFVRKSTIAGTYPGLASSGIAYPVTLTSTPGEIKWSETYDSTFAMAHEDGAVNLDIATAEEMESVLKPDVTVYEATTPYQTYLDIQDNKDSVSRVLTSLAKPQVVILPLLSKISQNGWTALIKNFGDGPMSITPWRQDSAFGFAVSAAAGNYVVIAKSALSSDLKDGDLSGGYFTIKDSGGINEQEGTLTAAGLVSCDVAGTPDVAGNYFLLTKDGAAFSPAPDNTWNVHAIRDGVEIDGPEVADNVAVYDPDEYIEYRFHYSSTVADRKWETKSHAKNRTTAINQLYVGKHGDDGNDGLTWDKAFLTPQAAIAKANTMGLSIANKVVVSGSDAGVFAGNLNLPSYCFVVMPNASLNGNHTLSNFSILNAERIVISSGVAALKNTGLDSALIKVPRVILTGLANGFVGTSGSFDCRFERMDVENGYGIGGATATGEMSCIGVSIQVTGSGTGAAAYGSTKLSIKVSSIFGAGTGRALWSSLGGKLRAEITNINLPSGTAWQVDAGSSAKIVNAEYIGAEIVAPTGNLRLISGDKIDISTASISGMFLQKQITIAADDVTPSVAGGNVLTTSANSGATAITTLDDAEAGQYICLIGGSDTFASTIAASATFAIKGQWTANEGEVLLLLATSASTFIEVTRDSNITSPQIVYKTVADTGATLTNSEIGNNLILVDTSGGATTLLLSAGSANTRAEFACDGVGMLTITPNGIETINGAASLVITNGQRASLWYDAINTNWILEG